MLLQQSELALNMFVKQLQSESSLATSARQRLQAAIDDLNEQLQQKCRELEVCAKECRDLQERVVQEAAISQGARDLYQRHLFSHAGQLPALADELKTCKQMLEEEKKLRGAAEDRRDELLREKAALVKRRNELAEHQQVLNGVEALWANGLKQ